MKKRSEPFPLSLAIIAHNEEANIRRLLESCAGLVSEIVLVVNDSTDRTVEIAEQHGARVYREKWRGYRDQKNLTLEKVTQPWVLALDCDEELSPPLRRSISDFFRLGGSDRCEGAYFARKVWFMERWIVHGDWYPDHSLRLFKSHIRWSGSPEHDKIVVDGPRTKLAGDLHHFSNPTINHHIVKMNTFSDIFLQRQLAAGKRWSPIHTVVRPLWRFFRAYVVRLGFLDGFPGLYIAVATSFATFVRYTRLYEHQRQDGK
jgi:glycosyltransferase involved in cell wall biosynthesis